SEWQTEAPRLRPMSADDSFDDILEMIRLYLVRRPDGIDTLRRVFRSEGIPLPIERLRVQAGDPRWSAMLKRYLASRVERIRVLVKRTSHGQSLDEIVRACVNLRESLWDSLRKYRDQAVPTTPVRRKWWGQRIRNCVSQLFQLTHREEYLGILGA